MINSEQTLIEFGYSPSELKGNSQKLVCVQCDYCDKISNIKYRQVIRCRKNIEKDTCGTRECISLKTKESNLLKYGEDHPLKSEEIKKKSRETCIERFGVESYGLTKENRDSFILRNNEKAREENRAKSKKTCLEKYGADNFLSSEEGKRITQNSLNFKYGKNRLPIIKKTKETINERYGVDSPSQINGFKNKIKEKNIKSGKTKLYEGMTMLEYALSQNKAYSTIALQIQKYGFEVAKNISKNNKKTGIEQIIEDILLNLKIEYKYNYKIGKYFSDFYIPFYNIIIECDGVYWHSDAVNDDKYYHQNKRLEYIKNGYNPLFFREDEIFNKKEIIKSILINKFHKNPHKVYARNTYIQKVDRKQSTLFFETYHLMGSGRGESLGIYCKQTNELLSVLQYTKHNDSIDIDRFASKSGYSIIGGLSKIISFIIKNNNVVKITSFVDNRYGDGSSLKQCGFRKTRCSPSFKWVKGINVKHRLTFPSNSGYENGYFKLWDCGQSKFEYILNKNN